MNDNLKNLLLSYGRSVLTGVTTLYLAGVTDVRVLTYALIAAVLPVFLRAVNPNDPMFGILPAPTDVETAAKTAVEKIGEAQEAVKKMTTAVKTGVVPEPAPVAAKKTVAKKAAPAKKAATK